MQKTSADIEVKAMDEVRLLCVPDDTWPYLEIKKHGLTFGVYVDARSLIEFANAIIDHIRIEEGGNA